MLYKAEVPGPGALQPLCSPRSTRLLYVRVFGFVRVPVSTGPQFYCIYITRISHVCEGLRWVSFVVAHP